MNIDQDAKDNITINFKINHVCFTNITTTKTNYRMEEERGAQKLC